MGLPSLNQIMILGLIVAAAPPRAAHALKPACMKKFFSIFKRDVRDPHPDQGIWRFDERGDFASARGRVKIHPFSAQNRREISDRGLSEMINSPNFVGERIEIGTMGGRTACRNCRYVDKYEHNLVQNPNGPKSIVADAADLPFANQSVSEIVMQGFPWSVNGEQYRENIRKVMTELKRVLKDGGKVIISEDNEGLYQVLERDAEGFDLIRGEAKAPNAESLLFHTLRLRYEEAFQQGFKITPFTADSQVGLILENR